MMKKVIIILPFLLLLFEFLQAQTVKNVYPYAYSLKRAEFFIDSDPGLGKGTNIPVNQGDTVSVDNINYTVNGLKSGTHLLGVRVCDSTGKWSVAASYPFWVQDTAKNAIQVKNIYPYAFSLKRAEYFIDTDPGLGKATGIPVTPGDTVSVSNISYIVNGLNAGAHLLGVRVCDSTGKWGVAASYPFWVKDTVHLIPDSIAYPKTAKVQYGEYYWGTKDPEYGKGFPFSFKADTSVNVIASLALPDSLFAGIHYLSYRVKTEQGFWSPNQFFTFEVCNDPPDPPVSVTDAVLCGGGGFPKLTASGAKSKKYAWYLDSWGGTPLHVSSAAGDSTFTASTKVTFSTSFFVSEMGLTCNGPRIASNVTVYQTLPKPDISSKRRCGPGKFTIKPNLQLPGTTFRWFRSDTSRTAFSLGDSLITDSLNATIVLYASTITKIGFCESPQKTPFQLIVLTCSTQVITFPKENSQIYGVDPPLKLRATTTSPLPIIYTYKGMGYVRNDTLFTQGIGDITVCANQPGSVADNYNAAKSVCQVIKSTFGRTDIAVYYDKPVCVGSNLRFIPSENGNGRYSWSGPNGFSSTEKNPLINNVSLADSGKYTLTVYRTSDTLSTLFYVKVKRSPEQISLTSVLEQKCTLDYVLLTKAENILRYEWYYNAKLLKGPSDSLFKPFITGVYFVKGYNKDTCGISSAPVFVNADPDSLPFILKLNNPMRLQSQGGIKYQWFIDNYMIAGNNSQQLPLLFNGYYKVKVTDTKGCEKFSPDFFVDNGLPSLRSDMVMADGTINLEAEISGIRIVPQPVNGSAEVTWYSPKRGKLIMEITDSQGKLVFTDVKVKDSELFSYRIALQNFSNGVYHLRLACEDKYADSIILIVN